MTEPRLHRRDVLRAIGTGSIVGVAGCTGSSEETTDEGDESDDGGTEDYEYDEDNVDDSQEDSDTQEEDGDEQEYTTHTVEFEIVDGREETEGEPMSNVLVALIEKGKTWDPNRDFRTPYTDENGITETEARRGVEYRIEPYDKEGNSHYHTVIETNPDFVLTRKGHLQVFEDTEVVMEVQPIFEDEEPTQISP